jgi:hypothetical protein
MTPEQLDAFKAKSRQRNRAKRASLTPEQLDAVRLVEKRRQQKRRARLSAEEVRVHREVSRLREQARRDQQRAKRGESSGGGAAARVESGAALNVGRVAEHVRVREVVTVQLVAETEPGSDGTQEAASSSHAAN